MALLTNIKNKEQSITNIKNNIDTNAKEYFKDIIMNCFWVYKNMEYLFETYEDAFSIDKDTLTIDYNGIGGLGVRNSSILLKFDGFNPEELRNKLGISTILLKNTMANIDFLFSCKLTKQILPDNFKILKLDKKRNNNKITLRYHNVLGFPEIGSDCVIESGTIRHYTGKVHLHPADKKIWATLKELSKRYNYDLSNLFPRGVQVDDLNKYVDLYNGDKIPDFLNNLYPENYLKKILPVGVPLDLSGAIHSSILIRLPKNVTDGDINNLIKNYMDRGNMYYNTYYVPENKEFLYIGIKGYNGILKTSFYK